MKEVVCVKMAAVPTMVEAAPADLLKAVSIEKEVVCAATAEVSTEKEAAPVTLMKATPDKLHLKELLKEEVCAATAEVPIEKHGCGGDVPPPDHGLHTPT